MKINKTVEIEEGTKVTFQGEIEGKELDFVLQVGLQYLMYAGLLPPVVIKKEGIPEPTDGGVH